MTRAAFGRSARLRNSGQFRAVFSGGRKWTSPGFVVFAAANAEDDGRLGLALAKRRIARAVDRNRIKRVVRESFRHARGRLAGIDVVVLARGRTVTLAHDELFAQLDRLWSDIAGSAVPPADAGQR